MSGFYLDNLTARRIFLDRHALTETPTGPAGPAEIQALIEKLGFVQVDSVQTVARAHHMILWSRKQRYRPATLARLIERDRSLFENWTHDAAIIPSQFFPYWNEKFQREHEHIAKRWSQSRGEGFLGECETILSRIAETGPVTTSEAGNGSPGSSGGWWEWHPTKTALEYLWRSGKLAITKREAFRKVYDLSERVIPEPHRQTISQEEALNWACHAALDRLGFATHGEIAAFWALVSPDKAREWCRAELAAGRLIEGVIEGADGRGFKTYARPGIDRDIPDVPAKRVRILSPFDPALRDRKRAEKLFGFRYRIEIFVPEPKRQYGYYVFPVMEGDELIGRIDVKANRDKDRLSVRAFWPETKTRISKSRLARLEAELARLARFVSYSDVEFADDWLRGASPSGR